MPMGSIDSVPLPHTDLGTQCLRQYSIFKRGVAFERSIKNSNAGNRNGSSYTMCTLVNTAS